MTATLEGGEWSAARPGRTLPSGKTRYPFYRRLGGRQGRPGRAENIVPTGIRSRTVQPVVSRYTDWATRPTISASSWFYYKNLSRCTVIWTSNWAHKFISVFYVQFLLASRKAIVMVYWALHTFTAVLIVPVLPKTVDTNWARSSEHQIEQISLFMYSMYSSYLQVIKE